MHTHSIIAVPGFAEPAASWLHLASALIVFVVAVRNLPKLSAGGARWAFGLFCFGAIFVFSMSGVFHLLDFGTTEREVLRRLDYSAIWMMVAGTLSALFYLRFRGARRVVAMVALWSAAVVGIVMASVFLNDLPELATLALYFVVCGASFWALWSAPRVDRDDRLPVDRRLFWGCVVYTVGAVVEFARGPVIIPGIVEHHEIFHIAVMIAATLHGRYLLQRYEALSRTPQPSFEARVTPNLGPATVQPSVA